MRRPHLGGVSVFGRVMVGVSTVSVLEMSVARLMGVRVLRARGGEKSAEVVLGWISEKLGYQNSI